MKVCFVSKECAGLRGGGIGTYIAEAGKALRAHGHEAWLLTWVGDASAAELRALPFDRVVGVGEGVRGEELPYLFHGGDNYRHSYLVHQTLMALGESFDYIEFADYEAEGLVPFQEQRHFNSYGDTVLGMMLHSPTWECFAYDGQSHRAGLEIRETCNIEEEAIRIAPLINSPSQGLRDEVLARLGLQRHVEIIRYPMDLGAEVPTPPPARTSLAELEILYYGRIEPRKGIEELIEAFRQLPECNLKLIGGDVPYSPYGKSYRDYIQRGAPDNVEFCAPMPRPDLLLRLQSADVCIFPSRFENWPNTCIEAMAAGRVVIGSKHGGMGEMIEHGVSGFHVDGRSAADILRVFREDLSGALGRLSEIGAAAARRIREFSRQDVYCETLQQRVEGAAAQRPSWPAVDTAGHKVSLVIPFYKDRETIDQTVDAACAQTHKNIEILIVSDGSPLSDAEEILQRQEQKDPRIRIARKPNGGLGSARNYAIDHAEGEFLLFCDADNIARPEYAAIALEALLRHPDSMFVTPQARFFEHGSDREIGVYNVLRFDRKASVLINRFGDAGAFFRRSLFIEHGLRYDEVLISYEDWALWMDIAGLGLEGERLPRVLYDYRVRSDSMIHVDGLPNHPALLGWLIQHHLPDASQSERDILTTVFQVAGQSIARVTFGQPDHVPLDAAVPEQQEHVTESTAQPAASTDGVPHQPAPPLRYKFVDEASRLSRKIPGLNTVLRSAMGALSRLSQAARRN